MKLALAPECRCDVRFRPTCACASRYASRMAELTQSESGLTERLSPRIVIKSRGRILFIDPREVITVEAERNYVVLQQRTGSHLMRESISRMAERLDPYGFVRIHRSVVVNSSYVEQIRRWPSGQYILQVRGGKEYTVTRTFRRNLKFMAHSWIPSDRQATRLENR